jgi:hypothetical protein
MSDHQIFDALDQLDQAITRARLMRRILAQLADEAEREHNCKGAEECRICSLVRMAREV